MEHNDGKRSNVYVVDVEGNGLLDSITKIHTLAYTHAKTLDVKVLYSYEDITKFLSQPDLTIIGHNFIQYDKPALEKVLGQEFDFRVVDTLGLAWFLESSNGRKSFGLESYGEKFGFPKVEVGADVWDGDINDPDFKQLMTDRVSRDVEINWYLWKEQQSLLVNLYDRDAKKIHEFIDFIGLQMDIYREQAETGLTLDVDLCVGSLLELQGLAKEKEDALVEAMPKIPQKVTYKKPKVLVKKDGTPSALGERWFARLEEEGFSKEEQEGLTEVEVITGFEEGNPNSSVQVKDWLFSIGWKPKHIKRVRDKKTNEVREIPQVVSEFDKSEVCDSVKELFDAEPSLEHLAGLSTLNHRIGILKGFIRDLDVSTGKLYQGLGGITNTSRAKHRVLVNLPKAGNPYADSIRACLVAEDESKVLISSDLSGIEDTTKLHYLTPIDPDFVREVQSKGYDAHTSVGVAAEMMTSDEELFFKWYKATKDGKEFDLSSTKGLEELQALGDKEQKELFSKLSDVRQEAKTVNFSAVYSVGAKTLAATMKVPVKKAQGILDAYWKKNRGVKIFSNQVKTKTINGQLWALQPISGFWYSLRNMKDVFSTINQGSATYVFYRWCHYVRQGGLKLSLSVHDEISAQIDKGQEEWGKQVILKAIDQVNEELQLHIKVKCDVQTGNRYSEIH